MRGVLVEKAVDVIVVVVVVDASGVIMVLVVVTVVVTDVVLVGVVAVIVVVVLAVLVVVVGTKLLTTPMHVTATGHDGGGFLLALGHDSCLVVRPARSDPAFGDRGSARERFLNAEPGKVLMTGWKPAGPLSVVVLATVTVVV